MIPPGKLHKKSRLKNISIMIQNLRLLKRKNHRRRLLGETILNRFIRLPANNATIKIYKWPHLKRIKGKKNFAPKKSMTIKYCIWPQKNLNVMNDHKKWYMTMLESKWPLLWVYDQSYTHKSGRIVCWAIIYKLIVKCLRHKLIWMIGRRTAIGCILLKC